MLSNKSFNAVFYFMLFGMLMGLALVGGVLALIVHLVGGPLWLLITLWALPPAGGLAAFFGLFKGMKRLMQGF